MPELASARPGPGAVQLLEVRGEDAPNVLTNDPGFFSHKTGDAAVLELKLSTEFRNNIKLNSPSIDILQTRVAISCGETVFLQILFSANFSDTLT